MKESEKKDWMRGITVLLFSIAIQWFTKTLKISLHKDKKGDR